ncbi:MAG: carbon storage regulator CsrA [Termitinemataceae bacterium]|nr:MAG: carbon storage regulator CsrA [Termitinemataceae bacterium]
MLILTRKTDEKIIIDENITVSIIEVRGDQVRIGVDAPKTVKVYRQEVLKAIQKENQAAAASPVTIPTLDIKK